MDGDVRTLHESMYQAGHAASHVITPDEPMWLAGYAVRTAAGEREDLRPVREGAGA